MESAKNEYEPLRAVDPGAAIEGRPVAPQPSHLGVAPLVGGEWSLPEGQPYEYGEADREAAKKWGAPREDLDRRTAALATAGLLAALAVAVWLFGLGLTPDRYLAVLFVPALVLRRARRYLLDFVPFAALLVIYAQSRGIAHLLRPDPYYVPQLDADKFLFGGAVPSESLQHWLWNGAQQWYDHVVLAVMRLHFIVPPLLAFILWVKRRALFYRFAATMITLSFAGALTFLLFPSAPPWAAGERGLLPGLIRIPHNPAPNPSGAHGYHAISVSKLIDPNPYAAIPSLHAGYAFLCFIFVATIAWKTRWRWLALLGVIYPLAQSFAVVYTGNHYVIDLLIGYAYAGAALAGIWWLWRRRRLPE